jgi:hypothetical protein
VIQHRRNVYELLRILPPSASAGGEAGDHASFALGSPRATGAVRARRTYTQFTRLGIGDLFELRVAICSSAEIRIGRLAAASYLRRRHTHPKEAGMRSSRITRERRRGVARGTAAPMPGGPAFLSHDRVIPRATVRPHVYCPVASHLRAISHRSESWRCDAASQMPSRRNRS